MIQLDNKSDLPIYEQITAQFKQAILRNELRPGDALPSIRALATMLHISVMTTKRAYADLERDGFIETIRGKGSYVTSQHPDLLREQFLQQAEALLADGIRIAASAKLSKQDIRDVFELLLEEEFDE